MSDEPQTENTEGEDELPEAELLPDREAMSVIYPTPSDLPIDLTLPAEPDIGDPAAN